MSRFVVFNCNISLLFFSFNCFTSYDDVYMLFRCGRLCIPRIVQWRRLIGLCNLRVTRSNSPLLTLFRQVYSHERTLTSCVFRVLLLVCVSLRILRRSLLHQKMVPFEYGISMVCFMSTNLCTCWSWIHSIYYVLSLFVRSRHESMAASCLCWYTSKPTLSRPLWSCLICMKR
jgi:hypothetical protein